MDILCKHSTVHTLSSIIWIHIYIGRIIACETCKASEVGTIYIRLSIQSADLDPKYASNWMDYDRTLD